MGLSRPLARVDTCYFSSVVLCHRRIVLTHLHAWNEVWRNAQETDINAQYLQPYISQDSNMVLISR